MSNTLVNLRGMTDPLADNLIQTYIQNNGINKINELFETITTNNEISEIKDDALRDFFEKSSVEILSDNVDHDLIDQGQKFFEKHGPILSLMLLCKSLPATYSCGNGAEVVYRTGRFMESKRKGLEPFINRLMETAQFVINVMSQDGMDSEGSGLVTAKKVRLMHASIRYYLKHSNHVSWDTEELGEPINQEDMLGTLLSFSVFPVQGLEQLGITVSDEEKKAYYYTWKLVGLVMGVEPSIIPETFDEGAVTGQKILEEQRKPTEGGKILTKSCVDFLKAATPGTHYDDFPEAFMHFLLGDEICETVGIETHTSFTSKVFIRTLSKVLQIFDQGKDESALLCEITETFNVFLLQHMLDFYYKEKEVEFNIPPSLKKNWIAPKAKKEYENIFSTKTIFNYRITLQKLI
ncbi:oxygenase MpaB family protein [Flammeovirga sp. SubArs3]|uniref:oxygenase MpaB family protein n=1 Tax=Flammeovirga sp. SubArs3 TaxID=2995316 RepID=UPI00248B87DF|nr:oxygenase MpaB family protein [Flammeovirga sp. SubArs3]